MHKGCAILEGLAWVNERPSKKKSNPHFQTPLLHVITEQVHRGPIPVISIPVPISSRHPDTTGEHVPESAHYIPAKLGADRKASHITTKKDGDLFTNPASESYPDDGIEPDLLTMDGRYTWNVSGNSQILISDAKIAVTGKTL